MALSFRLESPAVPATAQVVGFRGTEALTRPYVFDIYVATVGPIEIEPATAVGLPATLTLDPSAGVLSFLSGGPPVSYAGVIGRFQIVRATETSTLYKVTLVAKLWQLAMTKHSRVFTKMSVPDVLKAVLAMEGIVNVSFRLSGSYAPEEHITQYRESSLDFIHRWMEREGLYYYFEQNGESETLVVVDSLAVHEPNAHGAVRYHPTEGDRSTGRHFDNFVTGAMSLPATVRVTDYDYAKPMLSVMGMSPVWPNGSGEMNESSGDARLFTPADGARIAQVRAEALRAEGAETRATGAALGLSPGYTFRLEHHPRASLDRAYLVTRQIIVGHDGDAGKGWGRLADLEGSEQVLSVDITAIPADVQYREPKRTAWPRVDGYEMGVIDGPADSEYAQIDDLGRYAVKFNFDEMGSPAGQASTWVRMMQPHAGTSEGMHFPLRKSTEVVFLFLGGDPDRPVIAGAIPNALTPNPVTSANNTKNVLQTRARNRFEMEDRAGSEWAKLSTPGDNTHLFMGKPGEGGDHSFVLETDKTGLLHTGTDCDLKVDQKWDVKVGDTLTEEVQSDVTEKYHANLSQTVDGKKNVTVTSGQEETVDSGYKLTVTGGFERSITGEYSDTVTGPHTQSHDGPHQQIHSGPHQYFHTGVCQHIHAGALNRIRNGTTTELLNGTVSRTVNADVSEIVIGNVGWDVSANIGVKCVDYKLTSTTLCSEQSTSFVVKAGSASLTMMSGIIHIDNGAGTTISLVGPLAMVMAGSAVMMNAGAMVQLNAGAIISTSSGPTNLSAGGDINATAATIHLNG